MRILSRLHLVVLVIFTGLNGAPAIAQESTEVWQARTTVTANIELGPHSRVQMFGRFEGGLDYSYYRVKAGAAFSYRMKRILKPHREEIDKENEHNLVFGGGYEFLESNQNNNTKREHRISVDVTPRYQLGAGFLAADRNRVEMRWVDGVYNARYRNRLTVGRPLELRKFRFTPYATGELFYDRNLHFFNRTHYGAGVQFPHKGCIMVDAYYLHQNCTGCSENPLNIWGVTLNMYFNGKK